MISPLLVGGLSVAAMLVLIALGVPVAFAISLVAICGGSEFVEGRPLVMATLEGLP